MNILLVQDPANLKPLETILHKVLTFIYFLAHQIGLGIIKIVQPLFPRSVFPDSLIDPLGFLIVLTLFMVLVGFAKKAAWIIVFAAWILFLIRILMIIFKLG